MTEEQMQIVADEAGPWAVYVLVDPRDGRTFYAGCTTNPKNRAAGHRSDPHSAARAKVLEIHASGNKCIMRVLSWYDDKAEALVHEDSIIASFWNHKFPLANKTTFSVMKAEKPCLWLRANPKVREIFKGRKEEKIVAHKYRVTEMKF